MKRSIRGLAVLLLLLPVACFEKDPVNERVEVTLFGDGNARIRTVVDVAIVSDDTEHAVVRERARRVRSQLELTQDEWSRRYAQVSAQHERLTFRRQKNELTQVDRSATVAQDEIVRFFSDTALSFQFVEGFDWVELLIYCGRTRGATADQRSFVRDSLDRVAGDLAKYYAATSDLYAYLDARPDRAEEVFRKMFDPENLDRENEEDRLIGSFLEAADEPGGITLVDENRDYSLERASRLVYDPFPADLAIRVPGEIIEMEGFDRVESRLIRVPRIAFRSAFAGLKERWVSPDLLGISIEHELSGGEGEPLDPETLHELPRRWSRPSVAQVRAAIEERLVSRSQLRVRWSRPTVADEEQMKKLREAD